MAKKKQTYKERLVKTLKKLHREDTKGLDLSTKVMEDKRTKRNRTRSEQDRNAIKESNDGQ
jgi:hypothetical protein